MNDNIQTTTGNINRERRYDQNILSGNEIQIYGLV